MQGGWQPGHRSTLHPPAEVWGEVPTRLDELTRSLPARDREVLRLRHRDGLTQAEAGRRLGVSREWFRQVEAAALARLRERLAGRAEHHPGSSPRWWTC